MSNKKFDPFRRLEETPSRLYVILAILMLAIHIAICTYTDAEPAGVGLTLIILYALISLAVFLVSRRQLNLYRIESDASEEQNNSVIYAFRTSLTIPYAVVTETGKIVTVNNAMRSAAKLWETVFNADISSLCHCSMEEILRAAEEQENAAKGEDSEGQTAPKPCIATIGDGSYRVECHPIQSKGKPYYMLVFHDVTELTELSTLYHNNLTAVGYIVLDNLEEIAQYVKVSYQTEARQAESILKEWAADMGGVLREYDRNKYFLLFSREMLATCIKNKFDILDTIRGVRIGDDNMPITVSMGIATTSDSLAGRERDALVALDLALQRGGDQVVLKSETGNFYFGGRTKSQQKRTRGHSRIIAGKLCSMISGASNVIVMGHSNPDFDSIGACVGIAALALHLGVDVKIVTDTESENFKACTSRLVELADYKSIFVDGVVGLGESSFGTLLIVVDANNFSILEAPEIAAHSFKTAVIDHHIKKDEFEHEPQLSYIDPSASSTCELISEILEQTLPVGVLRKEEANILMAGIMVDTKNFTRTVGTRTFAAALYLRGAGASTEYARTFFEEAFEDYRAEAQFGSEARIYRNQIAITSIEGSGTSHDRIAAAKAADKLLTVRNVCAAFALIRIGSVVHVSARSDGSVNVQLILEKIGGGGHFDVAGAAIAESELKDAEQLLIRAIDNYFDEIEAKS
ncbi:MAG: DHH family phosphoesterase [Clostridia bacterium]|nr:DHH family phosphoesterase [Clostridia bacterium]